MKQSTPPKTLQLSPDERTLLEQLAAQDAGLSTGARRARIIILLGSGKTAGEICEVVGCTPQTVAVWRRRFEALRLQSLRHSPLRSPCNQSAPGQALRAAS